MTLLLVHIYELLLYVKRIITLYLWSICVNYPVENTVIVLSPYLFL